jgi:hypothetical protein
MTDRTNEFFAVILVLLHIGGFIAKVLEPLKPRNVRTSAVDETSANNSVPRC